MLSCTSVVCSFFHLFNIFTFSQPFCYYLNTIFCVNYSVRWLLWLAWSFHFLETMNSIVYLFLNIVFLSNILQWSEDLNVKFMQSTTSMASATKNIPRLQDDFHILNFSKTRLIIWKPSFI